ncbi:hypothetical protein RFI_32881, partial [Reticulomyxa filosa]
GVDIMQAHWKAIGNMTDFNKSWNCQQQASHLPWIQGLLLKYFDSNEELNKYCKKDNYGKTWKVTTDNGQRPIAVAIVFSNMSSDGTQWAYSIRANSTKVPGTLTETTVDKFQQDMDIFCLEMKFLQLQIVCFLIFFFFTKKQNFWKDVISNVEVFDEFAEICFCL